MLTKTISILAIISAASFAAVPANAASPDTVSVTIDRTELASEPGMQRTFYRLKTAATKACRSDERVSITQRVSADQCYGSVMESFLSQIKDQRLMAFYQADTLRNG